MSNLPQDPQLPQRMARAGAELYEAVVSRLGGAAAIHPPTAVAAVSYLAGVALLKAAGVNLAQLQPGAPVFVDAVNETGPVLFGAILRRLEAGCPANDAELHQQPLEAIPAEHQPRRSYEELVVMLWPVFEGILGRHGVPIGSAAQTCVEPLVRLMLEQRPRLPLIASKTLVMLLVVRAAKTVPPGPQAQASRLIGTRGEFARVLDETAAEVQDLVQREPAYPVWRQLNEQLQALRLWTANGASPAREQLSRISIGLIAVRELEPAQDERMYSLTQRLHQLSYYCSHWFDGVPMPPAKMRLRQKVAAAFLLFIGAVLVLWVAVLLALRVKPTAETTLGAPVLAGDYMARLVTVQEPYMVSIRPNTRRDHYRVSLVLQPTGGGKERRIPLAKNLDFGDLQIQTRILGADRNHLWLWVNGIRGMNLRTQKMIGADELRLANPGLRNLPGVDNSNNPLISPTVHRIDRPNNDLWNGEDAMRRFLYAGRTLRVRTPDYREVLEVDPDTLKAAPVR